MELQAPVLSIKSDMFLKEELDMSIDETFYWTDSMTVLRYLNNRETRYKTFVANRVGKILDHSSEDMCHHLRSEENPADIPSRGMEAHKEKWEFYHKGAHFLDLPQGLWSMGNVETSLTEEEEVEVRRVKEIAAVEMDREPSVLDRLCGNCSDWKRLVTRVACLTRVKQFLINKCRDMIRSNFSKDPPRQGPIQLPEHEKAERTIAIMLQSQSFSETIGCLKDQPTNFRLKASLGEVPDAQAF
jgi:hypothetical protein